MVPISLKRKDDINFEMTVHEPYRIEKSGNNYRFFPLIGMTLETPFKFLHDKNDFVFTPKGSLILTPGLSNSNKISNEDSSNNIFSIVNNNSLNRYSGSDKLDNSKRINYGINLSKNNINFEILQSYEFQTNNNEPGQPFFV